MQLRKACLTRLSKSAIYVPRESGLLSSLLSEFGDQGRDPNQFESLLIRVGTLIRCWPFWIGVVPPMRKWSKWYLKLLGAHGPKGSWPMSPRAHGSIGPQAHGPRAHVFRNQSFLSNNKWLSFCQNLVKGRSSSNVQNVEGPRNDILYSGKS